MKLRNTCVCFCLAIAGQLGAQDLPAGISLPEDRSLATKLSDAQAYLADQRWDAAVGLLQEVADGDPSALIYAGDDTYIGAVQHALELIADLPEPALAVRLALIGEQAELELAEAMDPADLHRLEHIARQYAGVPAGLRAQQLLQELWYDRGYPALAQRQGAAELRPEWQAALPPPTPGDALEPTQFHDLDDPSLPRIRAKELRPAWRFSFDDDAPTADLGHRMAFGHGLGFATNGREVVALELGSGQPRWHYRGPPGWDKLTPNTASDISKGASHLTLLAPVLADGVVLAVIQEPVGIGRSDTYSRIPIRHKLPARRLYAFDALDGSVLWTQQVPWLENTPRNPIELAAGPPAVAGGRVYLPVYTASGTVDLSLLAFDLQTGERLWSRFLVSGTMETNLFGNVLSELACPPPVADLDRVLVCTHFGAVCAVDAATGQALWTRTYSRTMVRTRQNGQIGNRDLFFHNNPPAYDGRRLVVAPTDSFYAMCLDATDGRRIGRWPAKSNTEYGTLSNLLGMDRDHVWFTGTNVVRLPLEAGRGTRRTSPALYEYVSANSANLNAGAITHRGILAMSTGGVVDLDPDSLSVDGDALSWESLEGRFIGPAQVTHGLVLLMTSKGIIAFASPGALLDTMVSRDLTPTLLRELLPLLGAVRYEEDPGLGRRVARTAEELAKRDVFADLAEPLRFLSGRTQLLVGETTRGLQQLNALLTSTDPRLRLDAASLILDAQPEVDASARRLNDAMAVLHELAPERVLTRDNRMEPRRAAEVRARALQALESRDSEVRRAGLVEVLLLEDPGTLNVEGIALFPWAEAALLRLLSKPDLRQAHEDSAAEFLASSAPNLRFLRAYGSTAAAQDWMSTQMTTTALQGEDRIQLLSWIYRFGSIQRDWPLLPEKLNRTAVAESLPQRLDPLVSVKLDGALLLHAMSADGAAYAFLQDDHLCRVLRLTKDGSRLVKSVPLVEGATTLPTLTANRFGTATGFALVYQDRWIHIDYQGNRQERLLSEPLFKSSAPLRIGDFAAIILRGAGRRMYLNVVDLETGLPYLEMPLDTSAERFLKMVSNGQYLFVLQDKATRVLRIDLLHAGPPTEFQLPFVPHWGELQAVRAFGDGIAIPSSRGNKEGAILIERPNRPARVLPFEDREFGTLPTEAGIGWWTRPAMSLSSEPGPVSVHWIEPGMNRPWTHRFLDPSVRIPQFLSRIRNPQRPKGKNFLAVQPAARDRIEVQAVDLGGFEVSWSALIPEILFGNLVEPTPIPRRAADGWVVLLRESQNRRSGARLHCFSFDDQGMLRGSYSTPSTARSLSSQRIHLLPEQVLLRNGDVITLLGKK